MTNKFNPIQYVEKDELKIMEVRNWAEVKIKLVGKYCDIFTSGMKNKWNLVYLDLFSGPGYVQKKKTKAIFKNCAMVALSVANKFDYYAFNDLDDISALSLKERIKRHHPDLYTKVFQGDANVIVDEMIKSIPSFNNSKGTLIFSFLDPFSAGLKFSTIQKLSKLRSDILVLHALQMDIRRNYNLYMKEENYVISNFTGTKDWRNDFKNYDNSPTGLMKFSTDEFDRNIRKLDYISASNKQIVLNDIGRGIYYLCFYSKNEKGVEFFEKIQKIGGNDQYEMF